jgi:hypothetical protein
MAGLGNKITTQIITKGLSCSPACEGLITTHFSLLMTDFKEPPANTGGGPYYFDHGSRVDDIQNFWKPVQLEEPLQRYDVDTRKKKLVTIKITLGERVVEREYIVLAEKANHIIKITNVINATKDKIKAVAKILGIVYTKAKVVVNNILVSKNK